MKRLTLPVSLGAAIALSMSLTPASQAQTSDDAQSEVFPSSEPGNGFGSSSFSPFDLIHRATMGTLRDPSQFRESTARDLNEAAAEFRRQQLERLQNPATPPAAEDAAPVEPRDGAAD